MRRLASLAGMLTTGAIAVAVAGAATDTVTIVAGPGIIRWPEGTSLAGRISNNRAGELVKLETKACPSRSFNVAASVRTTAGGAWAAEMRAETKSVVRARWRSARSRQVVVLVRPHLVLGQISRTKFQCSSTRKCCQWEASPAPMVREQEPCLETDPDGGVPK